jgi:hypothetical protein
MNRTARYTRRCRIHIITAFIAYLATTRRLPGA